MKVSSFDSFPICFLAVLHFVPLQLFFKITSCSLVVSGLMTATPPCPVARAGLWRKSAGDWRQLQTHLAITPQVGRYIYY